MRMYGTGLVILCCVFSVFSDSEAKITLIEGSARIMKKGTAAGKVARLAMPLQIGDQLTSGKESLVEITYRHGAIMRCGELTTCSIQAASDVGVSTSVPHGNVWVNMKKLSSVGRDFDVSTPTAVAAIRGTVFQMQALPDSSADVAVFDGKVAVGLSDAGKKRVQQPEVSGDGAPHEVPGPSEVPGPYEVTLDQWRTIIAGQRISIRSDGKFSTETFDLRKQLDAFIEKNRALDAKIKGAR
jgi:hypothetical protein